MFLISHKFWIFFSFTNDLPSEPKDPPPSMHISLANCTVLSLIGKTASP